MTMVLPYNDVDIYDIWGYAIIRVAHDSTYPERWYMHEMCRGKIVIVGYHVCA